MLRSKIAGSYDNSLFDLNVLIFKSFILVTIMLCLDTIYQCIPGTVYPGISVFQFESVLKVFSLNNFRLCQIKMERHKDIQSK